MANQEPTDLVGGPRRPAQAFRTANQSNPPRGNAPVTPPFPAIGPAPGKRTQMSMRLLSAQETWPSPVLL